MSHGRLLDVRSATRPLNLSPFLSPARPDGESGSYVYRKACFGIGTVRKHIPSCDMSVTLLVVLLFTLLAICDTTKPKDYYGKQVLPRNERLRFTAFTSEDNTRTGIPKETILRGFEDHDVTLPIRLHHKDGHPVRHGSHFLQKRMHRPETLYRRRRRRRSLETNVDDFDIDKPTVANYSVEAFGEIFRFHLEPYTDFISPMFTMDYRGAMTPEMDALIEDTPRHCFFAGNVNFEVQHKVVVSLCGGMFGAFRANDTEFLIEPYHHGMSQGDEVGTKLHRIHRRRKTPTDDFKSVDTCSNGGNLTDEALLNSAPDSMPIDTPFSKLVQDLSSVFNPSQTRVPQNSSSDHSSYPSDTPHSRKKRYMSYPRNVEVMVTADQGMKTAHTYNLQHYVLTLMAIVHHVYRHPSIGNQINIILVRLIIIGDGKTKIGPEVTDDAHECLRNFCEWQANENEPNDSHPDHYDTAILLTRRDLCRMEGRCDTLGLAELGTICNPLRSCAVIEDNGLSTAFTIAHEMGHEFNAPHDNSDKCRKSTGDFNDLHVMSPILDHTTKTWSWSKCSAKFITSFLDHGNGQCLLDDPPQRRLPLPLEKPGEIYDIDRQCRFLYGKNVRRCTIMTTSCARLWCAREDPVHGCRTPHMPWADGTKCGTKKWCKEGKCVREDRGRQPLDGGWGDWSRFGECSRSCEGGIRIALRECNNPEPANDGRYCVGKRKKFKHCNWHECPTSSDFRAEQCRSFDWSKHNYYPLNGIPRDAEWIPKYDGIVLQDRCKLICQVTDSHHSATWYVLQPTVINGTPCGPNTYDMCVEGICMRAGCDHILNSRTKVDDCGVCGGDNSGCRTVKGVFEHSDNEGYHFVAEIPAGSTNIVIEQRSAYGSLLDDRNYLALRDATGAFILNGNRSVVQYEQTIEKRANSVTAKYSYRFDYSGCNTMVERINSTGSITENVTLLVLTTGSLLPPNIKYRYNVPLPDHIIYIWDQYGPLRKCNSSCQGVVERKILCIRAIDRQTVADHKCQALHKPSALRRKCNTHCSTQWRVIKEECSSRCGQGFIQYHLQCIRVTTTDPRNDSLVEAVQKKYCSMHSRPSNETVCFGECLATSWRFGEWSACSHTCGGGFQTRTATCEDLNGDLPATDCDAKLRFVSRICNAFVCPQWMAGDFSKCLTTCGKGLRRREVSCRGSNGQIVDSTVCDPGAKPPSTVMCEMSPCPKWKYSQWGECSATCGEGTVIRAVRCVDHLDRETDQEQCDGGLREEESKTCLLKECLLPEVRKMSPVSKRRHYVHSTIHPMTSVAQNSNPPPMSGDHSVTRRIITESASTSVAGTTEWRTGSWTECSASCGNGERKRYVSCRPVEGRELPERYCNLNSRPPSVESCSKGSCAGKWRSGAWSECSVTCGGGTRARYVQCMVGVRAVDGNQCDQRRKPQTHSDCETSPPCDHIEQIDISVIAVGPTGYSETVRSIPNSIGGWVYGQWSECSSSCGTGRRERLVKCRGKCERRQKPVRVQQCYSGPCPRWTSGVWSKCSTTCGRGIASRSVVCVMPGGVATEDNRCDFRLRPTMTTACLTAHCKGQRWRTYRWSECSVTCGHGLKKRRVVCVDRRRREVAEELCFSKRRRPSATRKCRTHRRCPRWHTGAWGECSVTCGIGNQARSVDCRDRKRGVITSEYCGTNNKPKVTRVCNGSVCSKYIWKATEWSSCSMTCGVGSKSRYLYCSNSFDQRVPKDKCPGETMPEDEIPCYEGSCSNHWWTEAWSMCSTSCGLGVESRTVRCVRTNEITSQIFPASTCDRADRPVENRPCNVNTCDTYVIWRLGPWSECSVTCGDGWRRRQVRCSSLTAGRDVDPSLCNAVSGDSPHTVELCERPPCLPASCRQVRNKYRSTVDGEYTIQLRGKAVQVYCNGMRSRTPLEYISLVTDSDENYSEVYGHTLNDPNTCPYNGSRNESCSCSDHPQSGKTVYRKIRLILDSMKIQVDDFTFATSEFGATLSYAVAGDCYSRAACPQGRFKVNLSGTGLVVSPRTTWNNYGRRAVQNIQRIGDGKIVKGKCGGYCGQCHPDPTVGLVLSVADGSD